MMPGQLFYTIDVVMGLLDTSFFSKKKNLDVGSLLMYIGQVRSDIRLAQSWHAFMCNNAVIYLSINDGDILRLRTGEDPSIIPIEYHSRT